MILDETETPLVLVRPDDRADTVLARARQTGAARVQLLVPDGVAALQRPDEAERLRALADAAGIELVLISSDPATLTAARHSRIQTVAVQDARVVAPSRPASPPISPYSTRVLADPPAPPVGPRADDLDAVPRGYPAASADEELAAAEASLAAALDEAPPPRPALSDEELLAATLAREPGLTPPRGARPVTGETLPARQAPAYGVPARATPVARPGPARPPRELDRSDPVRRPPVGASAAPPRRRTWPIFALIFLLLLLMGAIGAVLLWGGRVTVTVTPPVRSDAVESISALPVPVAPPGSAGETAVAAEPIAAEVSFSAQGQVLEGTLTPSGTAEGSVSILNSTTQQILLPAGTEFIAVTADGREVPFVSTAEVLVPGATTSDTGAQIVTSRGQANIPVAARSPGSGSNVDANTIRRVIPPGGVPFNVDTGSFLIQHPPLIGGTEEEVRIVKDSDVEALLAAALEGLDAEARRQLGDLAAARGLALDTSTILPRRSDLEQRQGFEYSVQPPVGETLDPANPTFTLTTVASYSGLATPPDRTISQQLGAALTEQLRLAGRLTPGDCRAPAVTSWRWDGQSLLVEGQISPDTTSPGCTGGLDAAALDQVREAVSGKSRAEAQAALDDLVARNVIGGYTLPEVEQLPGWDWQLQIEG